MTEYYIEKLLKERAQALHQRMKDSVSVFHTTLWSFLSRFPSFTDHSMLHSMDVLEFCNEIIGAGQIRALNAAECYVLIMSCYMHDTGMGISDRDYQEFSKEIDFGDYFETRSREDTAAIVRDFHNEFSGCFIRKYARLFEIPEGNIEKAVIQVSRGHRKTDLYDEAEYPLLETEWGPIDTPYLAAVLRLADEIDMASDRNPEFLYKTSNLTRQKDIEAFGVHESIRRVEVQPDRIVFYIRPKAPEFVPLIENTAEKIQKTLDYCRNAAAARSDRRITQEMITLEMLPDTAAGEQRK